MTGKIIGMDASRNRSGGAVCHIVELIKGASPLEHGISKVHLWAYKSLMDKIPDYPWLIKHTPLVLEKSLAHQMWWQYAILPQELRRLGCDILFSTSAGSICRFEPSITISQDMLSYEPGEMKRYGLSKSRLRLLLLRYIQSSSLKRAKGAIFLTNYAQHMIQKAIGVLDKSVVIPHAPADGFRQLTDNVTWSAEQKKIRCIYVSHTAMYKHQWNVIKAIGEVRKAGFDISLLLVGSGAGRAQKMVEQQQLITDPNGEFIEQMPYVEHNKIPGLLAASDVFIFASSCENMPITLIEGMASGLPIACSNRGPMPEVLQDGGVYFDPENPESIAEAIKKIVVNSELREKISIRAKLLSEQYSWDQCASQTWSFIESMV